MSASAKYFLVIEDDDANYALACKAFELVQLDVELLRCWSGDDGLEYLEKLNQENEDLFPELILLDLNLPGISGHEVLKQIKTSDNLGHIPVVVLSGSNNPEDINTSYSHGANSYITKPFGFKEYIKMAENIKEFWLNTSSLH